MTKKPKTADEFDALKEDEQNEVLDEIKESLGDAVLDLKVYVPQAIKDWWDETGKRDKGGQLSYEMLMSQFLIASLNVAINEGEEQFKAKTSLSLMVLIKQLRMEGNKVYMGDAVDKDSCCGNPECSCNDDGEGDTNGGGQTFH